MRKIIFRGQRKDNGKWVYGYLADGCYINDINAPVQTIIEVDSRTVGQFTGLKDRNGKEIHEGDILRIGSPGRYLYQVIWIDVHASFGYEIDGGVFGISQKDASRFYEVVGNIHDNPDLIKSEL